MRFETIPMMEKDTKFTHDKNYRLFGNRPVVPVVADQHNAPRNVETNFEAGLNYRAPL